MSALSIGNGGIPLSRWHRVLRATAATTLVLLVGACEAQPPVTPKEPMTGVGITGIDHLADHLSVQEFSIDGYKAGRAGGGGGTVCCAMLPETWRPGLTVRVDWVEQNWRDCSWRERHRQVPVARYEQAGHLWVHFLADDAIRVVSSGRYAPESQNYPGPHDPIPQKAPWHVYPADAHCHKQWTEIKEP